MRLNNLNYHVFPLRLDLQLFHQVQFPSSILAFLFILKILPSRLKSGLNIHYDKAFVLSFA